MKLVHFCGISVAHYSFKYSTQSQHCGAAPMLGVFKNDAPDAARRSTGSSWQRDSHAETDDILAINPCFFLLCPNQTTCQPANTGARIVATTRTGNAETSAHGGGGKIDRSHADGRTPKKVKTGCGSNSRVMIYLLTFRSSRRRRWLQTRIKTPGSSRSKTSRPARFSLNS